MTEPSTREPENRSTAPLGGDAVRRAFERLPHGLAVVAPSGAFRTANAALRELLDLPPGPVTCRAALGCRVPAAGRPGAAGAYLRRAARRPGALGARGRDPARDGPTRLSA